MQSPAKPTFELIEQVRRGLGGMGSLAAVAGRQALRPTWAWLFALGVPLFEYPTLMAIPVADNSPISLLMRGTRLLVPGRLRLNPDGDWRFDWIPSLLLGALLVSALVGWSHANPRWPEQGAKPGVGELLRARRGLYRSTLALLAARLGLGSLVLLLLGTLPTSALSLVSAGRLGGLGFLMALAVVSSLGLALVYLTTLDAACWLAFNSVAANRRGAGSAFQHAWRLLTNDPGLGLRAVGIYGLVCGLGYAILLPAIAQWSGEHDGFFVVLAASGLSGWWATRYWMLAYRALGGVSTLPEPGTPASPVEGAPAAS